jgi:hypothetical protein
MAAPQGFEPRYADPESAVLPLNEGATKAEKGSCSRVGANPHGGRRTRANSFIIRAFSAMGQSGTGPVPVSCGHGCRASPPRGRVLPIPDSGTNPMPPLYTAHDSGGAAVDLAAIVRMRLTATRLH